MTVKTQGGKVITKGGKVSCSCCEPPPAPCCMYRAQELIDGSYYTRDDLPDELIIFNLEISDYITLYKIDDEFLFYESEDYPEAGIFLEIDPLTGFFAWHLSPGGIPYGDCLIDDVFVKYNFANTYTISRAASDDDLPIPPTVLTRTSLCEWRGVDACGIAIVLRYNETDPEGLFGFIFAPYWSLAGFGDAAGECAQFDQYKLPFSYGGAGINSPVGEYFGVGANITVS